MSTDTPDTKSNKVVITTETRQELFDACAMLAQGIGSEILNDRQNPLVIRVDGGWNCGKTVIADAMRRTLLSSASTFAYRGLRGFDEYWTADVRAEDGAEFSMEIDFINILKRYGYSVDKVSDPFNHDPQHVFSKFLEERRNGGVSFVHNASDVRPEAFGLDIYLGVPADNTSPKQWLRHMAVDIRDPRLLLSPKFMKAVEDVRQGKHLTKNPYDVRLAFTSALKESVAISVEQVKRSVYPRNK